MKAIVPPPNTDPSASKSASSHTSASSYTNASAFLQGLLRPTVLWPLLVLLAALVYLVGLGSPYAPTNGDEMVYIHIARMTAESGQWLPLQSELEGTRNTKPPLLIWQAMVAGDWGAQWSLFALRLPSIFYTFATTAILGWFTWRISGQARTAWIAAAFYLLCFSTFRYGRAYLTSAPETFWLALPMWWVLWLRMRLDAAGSAASGTSAGAAGGPSSGATGGATGGVIGGVIGGVTGEGLGAMGAMGALGWKAYTLMGIAMGLGAAYKSFALVAPAAAAVWLAAWLGATHRAAPAQNSALDGGPKTAAPSWLTSSAHWWHQRWRPLMRLSLGLTWSAVLGLAIFALWFAIDPDPAAVWQEFVVAENAGKMSNRQGYWHAAFFGAYPMWTQLLAYPFNAGLLVLVGLGLLLWGVRHAFDREMYARLRGAHWVLLAWLLVWLVVFTIPSQRSERYLIPAMPAFAIVMALLWERVGRLWFVLTLFMLAPALLMLGRITWVIGSMDIGAPDLVSVTLLVVVAGLAAVVIGLRHAPFTRAAALVAVLAVYGSFTLMVMPLSTGLALYPAEVQAQVQGKRLAVPNGFTGQYERYHFALRGARITPYDAEGRDTGAYYPHIAPPQRLELLLQEFDAVVWLQESPDQAQPTCAPQCRVLGQRWHVKSRHRSGEVTLANLWYPQQWLFRREWLVVPARF